MPKVGFYVSEKEKEWIRLQGPGWFRRVLRVYVKNFPDKKMPFKEEQ